MTKWLFILACGATFAAPAQVTAQSATNEEIAIIRAEIGELMRRLDRLEQASATASVSVQARAVEAEQFIVIDAGRSNTSRVEISGDLRFRHEVIDDAAFADRQRQRIRARVGIDAEIAENVNVGLRLATGGDNPASRNQTLDGGFSTKSLGFERAFFEWQINDSLDISGGKMPNPFFRSGGHHLIWDNDVNPEGLALGYSRGSWFTNVAALWVDERSSGDDGMMFGGQAGYTGTLGQGAHFTAGVSYYDYRNTQGHEAIFLNVNSGNRLDANGNYLNDFNELELFGQLDLTVSDRPLRLFIDYVDNTEADDADTGLAFGAVYGGLDGQGTWEFGYAYQDLEADAVIAAFTDTDFSGGGTDGKGHVFDIAYGFADHWSLAFKYSINERGGDERNERDYNRLQADINFRY